MITVPSTTTYAQVSKPAANETPEQRMIRLAAKATVEGCRLVWPSGAGYVERVGVTSGTRRNVIYTVDVATLECGCPGFQSHGFCKHQSLVLAEIGMLPEPSGPAAVGIATAA